MSNRRFLASVILLIISVPAVAQGKRADELLKELNAVVPPGQQITVPTAKSGPSVTNGVDTGSSDNGSRALENLNNEEANRTQRQILERLPP